MVHYQASNEAAFAAIADPTRRGILEHLGAGDASISDLASAFGMTLTGLKKHVAILEAAGLVATRKVGRVRTCSLGTRSLEAERAWIRSYQQMLEARLDSVGAFFDRTTGE